MTLDSGLPALAALVMGFGQVAVMQVALQETRPDCDVAKCTNELRDAVDFHAFSHLHVWCKLRVARG